MEDYYDVENAPMARNAYYPALSPIAANRLSRYQAHIIETTAMAAMDIQSIQAICACGVVSHSNIVGIARQAAELYPEAADRFQSLAVQHYCHLSNIIDDYVGRR